MPSGEGASTTQGRLAPHWIHFDDTGNGFLVADYDEDHCTEISV
ncbi:hypothetical protein [Streptomyces sp. PRh5]|nr:hypothetical protein [Streptomyces sp. PRh5]